MSEQNRLVGEGDILVTLTAMPLALVGLIWLSLVTNLPMLAKNWPMSLLLGCLIVLFNRLNYFIIVEIRKDRYGSADGSLASAIQWSGVFLFGPTMLWLPFLGTLAVFLYNWRKISSKASRWSSLRNISLELASLTIAYLVALAFYQRWGGVYPFPGF